MQRYRIINTTDDTIVANNLSDLKQAQETVWFYSLDDPSSRYELESYTVYNVTGLGRDPDLHEDSN